MAFLEVLKYPDPRLKVKAAAVDNIDSAGGIDSDLLTLIGDMRDTMYADKGIGLAAVQVGVAKRLILLDVPDDDDEETPADPAERKERKVGENFMALVNPEIVKSSGQMKFEEGCLSVPGFTAEVKRAEQVTVKALDVTGMVRGDAEGVAGGTGSGGTEPKLVEIEADGLLAVALQHEIDHLDGILFIDRLSRLKRDIIKRKLKKVYQEALDKAQGA